MRAHEVIIQLLDTARFVTGTYLSDLSDADLLVRPVSGAHHIAWQLGHLLQSECSMIERIEAGVAPKLPEGFAEAHSKEKGSEDGAGAFLSKAAYLELMTAVRQATKGLLARSSDADLDTPGPEAMRSYAPTVGSVFSMIGSHEIMHSGQIAVVRRKLGKVVVL
jgi:uncharacterized damage-inducible protein DinB